MPENESWRNFYCGPSDVSRPSDPNDDGYPFRDDEGRGTVELPLRVPVGSRRTESIEIRAFPAHVLRQVERSFDHGDDPAGDPFAPGEPHKVLGWYVGVAEGSELLDRTALGHLNKHLRGLTNASDRRKYFNDEVKPFLQSMTPARRPQE